MLDTSAIRNLEGDQSLVQELTQPSEHGGVEFVVCRTVSEELWAGNRCGKGSGTPPIPVTYVSNTVDRVDVMSCDDSIGDGEAFEAHLDSSRASKRLGDALIADAVRWHADVLVSDDTRSAPHFRRAVPDREIIRLANLLEWLRDRPAGVEP